MKKILCIILSTFMVIAAIPLTASADNGPYADSVNIDGWDYYPAFGSFVKVDELGEPVFDGMGESIIYRFWYHGAEVDESLFMPGTSYDLATNTLTLDSVNIPQFALEINMMGEDFTILVKGECHIGAVACWGDGWGGNITIAGKGTLYVNETKARSSAFTFDPEYAPNFCFKIEKNVTVKMYAREGCNVVTVITYPDELVPENPFVFANDASPSTYSEHPVEYVPLQGAAFFSDGSTEYGGMKVTRDDDPDGLYGAFEVTTTYPDESVEKYVTVERYIYSESLNTYFRDYAYEYEHATSDMNEIRFKDIDEMEAAGYKLVYNGQDEVWNDFSYPWVYSSNQDVYYSKYDESKETLYTYTNNWDDETSSSYEQVYIMVPIPELEGSYYCYPTDSLTRDELFGMTVEGVSPMLYTYVSGDKYTHAGKTSGTFIDVPDGKWFTEGVNYCVDKGFMSGVSRDRFDPNGTLTRAMFVVILAKVACADLSAYTEDIEGLPFTDVKPSAWYTKALKWAYENKYTSGVSASRFGTNDPVTRQQLASFLCTFAKKNFIDVTPTADITGFSDYGDVAAWARDAMSWAVGEKLISGTGNNMLSPKKSATRAQVALIIMNYAEDVIHVN